MTSAELSLLGAMATCPTPNLANIPSPVEGSDVVEGVLSLRHQGVEFVTLQETILFVDCSVHSRCTVMNGSLLQHSNVSLLGHVSKIVSILLSKLSDCPTTDTLLCY